MESDLALVSGCLRGEASSCRDFVERFQGEVFRLCLHMLGNRADAEDVAQETFIRLFRYLDRWDKARRLKPWILQVTANRCRTALVSRNQRPKSLSPEIDVADLRPPADGAELAAEIRRAVDQLRVDYRQVFLLYHEHGLDYAAIGEAMGKPVGTVKTWLHRARAELFELLKNRGMLEEHLNDVRT